EPGVVDEQQDGREHEKRGKRQDDTFQGHRLEATVNGTAPARASTASAPTPTSLATRPSSSMTTAEGVPPAPNTWPAPNSRSRRTRERNPCSRFAFGEPAAMTASSGAPSGRSASHAFTSSSIDRQKA